jgi:hypothetical protein
VKVRFVQLCFAILTARERLSFRQIAKNLPEIALMSGARQIKAVNRMKKMRLRPRDKQKTKSRHRTGRALMEGGTQAQPSHCFHAIEIQTQRHTHNYGG